MTRRDFSGREIAKVLINEWGFEPAGGHGSHRVLYYEHPDNPADRRRVTVPMHDSISTGTLRDIADQAGADSFQEFCREVNRCL
ncbi:type II toxin-antitoxin system HicA family toxin [Haloarcula hispanica]|jgi:predicted RNA binding protein YcfA (HicA-like mRNA interferase family)|uniref:Type II toxin-antitoxin system HicA family toxin n=1 Tax=Haloarcula hispanica TaxID=51589 RepID=A0A5J5LEN7_HALHI|nr:MULTISPECIES: type II toxin-antitoxin system HicA family toxin [Haloarcula]KAA9404712.1 type II toxin-antitoxin system HicA family toxin [Haloarcula hispanica]MUV49766.1 addiction module toxin, HicA family [Haloarcula sp. CBA1122]